MEHQLVSGFKLKPESRQRLETMAEESGKSMTRIVTLAIDLFWEHTLTAKKRGEERARRTDAMFGRLKERLGDDFWRGQEIQFAALDEPMVQVGDILYVEAGPNGELTAIRTQGGRVEMAPVDKDGIGEWRSGGPAAPPEFK